MTISRKLRFLVATLCSALVAVVAVGKYLNGRSNNAEAKGALEMHVPDIAEQIKTEQAAHHALVRDHEKEAVDVDWAARTRTTLKSDIEPLARAHRFAIKSLECRTMTCVGTLSFSSYVDARRDFAIVASTPNHAGCGTEITLDDPPGDERPFEVQIVYRCNRLSSAEVRIR